MWVRTGGRSGQMPKIELAEDGRSKEACAALLNALPDWFGLPSANAAYVAGVASRTTFVAQEAGQDIGLLALQYHPGQTAEVWLMAVHPAWHRRGVGRALMTAAIDHAKAEGSVRILLNTMGVECGDKNYAATRAFYEALGFKRLIGFTLDRMPMIWMIRDIAV